MARLTIALALVACSHAFQGPLAPRAPAHKAPAVAQPGGARNWLTKLRAAVADPAPVTAETKQDRLAEYVAAKGGTRVIRRVLIANNGMAATKSIMSMRRWAYLELGDERALEFIVMARRGVLEASRRRRACTSIASMACRGALRAPRREHGDHEYHAGHAGGLERQRRIREIGR